MQKLNDRIRGYLWHKLKDHFYDFRIEEIPMIQNINMTAVATQKKAVVCYITDSYTKDWANLNIGRTQPFEILSIIKVLSVMGYSIDLINCNDIRALGPLGTKKYDLVFGFGEAFYELVKKHPKAISVLYMTEHHPEFTEREERKRLDYFYERTGKKAPVVRTGNFYRHHHFTLVNDYILTMSEMDPFVGHAGAFPIFPTGLFNENAVLTKDFDEAKKHFLWFGSYGAIHKGLDLLLDVFKKRDDLFLHIGGFYENDRKVLGPINSPNIFDHGYIDIYSDTFVETVRRCAFSILPSCSEGCSTSITTGMRHGLIPVVIKDTGFNRLGDTAEFLTDYKVDYIDAALTALSATASDKLEKRSKVAFEFAQDQFTIEAFEGRLKSIMQQIVQKGKKS